MLTLLIYCKDHKRRPIRFGRSPIFQDTQGQIPAAWCPVCGSEVFDRDQPRCIRCLRMKGEKR